MLYMYKMTCLRLQFVKSMILMMNEWQDWHAAENDNLFLLKGCFYINMKSIFVRFSVASGKMSEKH